MPLATPANATYVEGLHIRHFFAVLTITSVDGHITLPGFSTAGNAGKLEELLPGNARQNDLSDLRSHQRPSVEEPAPGTTSIEEDMIGNILPLTRRRCALPRSTTLYPSRDAGIFLSRAAP